MLYALEQVQFETFKAFAGLQFFLSQATTDFIGEPFHSIKPAIVLADLRLNEPKVISETLFRNRKVNEGSAVNLHI